MAFYYCYQQQALPEPQPPQSTAPELNTPLPSFLLLSPRPQQHLTLPLLTPILPSLSTTTTVATSEYNEQQQLPTPNTFIRHCEDMGLFHDLQNVIVMSPLARQFDDTVATTVTASVAADITTTNTPNTFTTSTITTPASTENPSLSNSFRPLSTAVLKTMMMANPFDETFKQAMLRQQKKETNLVGNHFNTNNNNDDELNTPFIVTSTDLDSIKINSCRSTNEVTSDLVTTSSTVEPVTISSIESKQQNINIVPLTEGCKLKASSSVLVTMVEQKKQQKPYSIVSPQNQPENYSVSKKRIIAPTTVMTNNVVITTSTNPECQNLNNDVGSDKSSNKYINVGSKSVNIKQVLKQNLLEKHNMQHEQLRTPVFFKTLRPENNGVDIVSTTTVEHDGETCNNTTENQKNQILELKKRQELLERNRTAAKRSRLKRKERWELLSEENRRLKIENVRLHKIISKLTGSKT